LAKYRFISILICAAILCSFTSCKSEAAEEPLDMFVSRLTETGTGLVRDVPPSSFQPTQPLSLEEKSMYVRWINEDVGSADLRWIDCKALNESDTKTLLHALPNVSFNSDTVWPDTLPENFDPEAIMENGKNPGLGVRSLHEEGITGKGVSIAIIDQTLLTSHVEYRDNLALYEEIHVIPQEGAAMHGSAVSSIAVGKSCGVAPDAKLYYWAVNLVKDPTKRVERHTDETIAFGNGLAVAIDRMLEINEQLPEGEKIRVLSISRGFSDLKNDGVKILLESIERAKDAGIFVLTTSNFHYYDFIDADTDYSGLGKEDFTGDPDVLATYTLGTWEQSNAEYFVNKLLAPMDARTTADFTGEEDYVFYPDGGYSWVGPYLAGLYALAVQVMPEITPELFWKTAYETSSELDVKIHTAETVSYGKEGESHTLSHIINPPALIEALQSK